MTPHSHEADRFKRQLGDSLKLRAKDTRTREIAKNENIYTSGDKNENVYFIESGQIKLLMFSPAGKECLLAIYSAGDVFGELCLSHSGERRETATAMNDARLKMIPCSKFVSLLTIDSLLEGFIKYLAVRISEQQERIGDLVMADSEQRLGKTLLQLGGKAGRKDPGNIEVPYKITHEELSAMVGTTRPRISKFMRRFRELGLVAMSANHSIVVKEKNLAAYLERFN